MFMKLDYKLQFPIPKNKVKAQQSQQGVRTERRMKWDQTDQHKWVLLCYLLDNQINGNLTKITHLHSSTSYSYFKYH